MEEGWQANVNYTVGSASSGSILEKFKSEAHQRAAYEAFKILGYIPQNEAFVGREERMRRADNRRIVKNNERRQQNSYFRGVGSYIYGFHV